MNTITMKLDGSWQVAYGPVGKGSYADYHVLPAIPAQIPLCPSGHS